MTTFINNIKYFNKSALIWAFNEMIDKDTDFDGNLYESSISETRSIINYLYKQNAYDTNITENILHTYYEILIRCITIDKIEEVTENKQYILCGWRGHAILLFWEKQESTKLFNVGIINCGQGIDIQGYNDILCNGILIFKNIKKKRINIFLDTYKNYYEKTKNDHTFNQNKIYSIFYSYLIC